MTSFKKKVIEIRVTKAEGEFGAKKGSNTKIIRYLRTIIDIRKDGNPSKNIAKIQIYGLSESDMNDLATLSFKPMAVRKNFIQIFAGDETDLALIFQGEIANAWAVYRKPPDLYLYIQAIEGLYPAVLMTPAQSFQGSVNVADTIKNLALSQGYAFEGNDVDTVLSDTYLHGSAWSQMQTLADAANLEFGLDDGCVYIAKRGRPRNLSFIPLISADTGMKEMPVFDKKGIKFECLFNPDLKLGGRVSVYSQVLNIVNGEWRIYSLLHQLDSEKPDGKWFSQVKASSMGAPGLNLSDEYGVS